MSRITIKDIARELGINVSTVSRALSGHPNVLPETRRKVQEAAERLGYVPNQLAANLRRQHSSLVALILADINMFFLPSLIRAIEEQARESGYHLIILQSNCDPDIEAQHLQICRKLAVEGIMVSLAAGPENLPKFEALTQSGIPVVFFDKVPPGKSYNTVSINDQNTADKAVRFLIEKGHRNIVGLFGSPTMIITQERIEGYRKSLTDAGIPVREDWILYADSIRMSTEKVSALLPSLAPGTAFFAMSDELMVGAVQAIEIAGRHMPDDLALLCISDGYAPDFFNPKVSHIHHSGYDIGVEAWQMMARLLSGEQTEPEQFEMECELIELGTTKR